MKKGIQRWMALTLALCMLAATALGEGLVLLPESLKVIEEQAFYGDTSVEKVIVQEGTETIGAQAFANSSLRAITLPGSVTSIADDVFDGCDEVEVSAQEGTYAYEWAVEKGMSIAPPPSPASDFTYTITSGNCTITKYIGTATEVIIPDQINGATVKAIGDFAFDHCSSLKSVVLPSGLATIGFYAFYCCTELSDIVIPEGVTRIDSVAFEFCSQLASVTIPASVVYIGPRAFTQSGIKYYEVDAGNKQYTSVGGILFSKNMETLCAYPSEKEAEQYTIPQSVKYIAECAFFSVDYLKEIMIPDSVTDIGYNAFAGCKGLSSITIPTSVTNIGDEPFNSCINLTSIQVDAQNSAYASMNGVLFDKNISKLIACPAKKTGAYVIPDGVTNINSAAFHYCSGLTNITIPNSVTTIDDWAFGYCENLVSLTIPDSVTNIGRYAFFRCGALESITIPGSVKDVEGEDFAYCTSLSNVLLSEGVVRIVSAFRECPNLTSIVIPSSVIWITENAFDNCPNVTAKVIENSYAHTWCEENGVAYVLAE